MRLHRFFIEESLRNKKDFKIFEDDIIHQWKNVFRLRAGDRVMLLDNTGFEYLSEVVLLAKGEAEIKIVDASASENMTDKDVWLFASIIKKDNYEWILEKCTEIGVSHFVPVVSDRTEKKDLNIERAHKIIKEASEQSERGMMPTLHDVRSLEESIAHAEEQGVHLIAFHSDSAHPELKHFTHEVKEKLFTDGSASSPQANFVREKKKVGVLIGPEGGWADREVNLFKEKNIPLYTLGSQVLRAETAAIAIATLLLL